MRKVKYNSIHNVYYNLTDNKVYDVIEFDDDHFEIINDNGDKLGFRIYNNLFINVTSEYRSELIDEILA